MSQSGGGSQSQAGGRSSSMPQTKEAQIKSYQKRLRDDIKAMTDNFMEIVRLVKVSANNTIVNL